MLDQKTSSQKAFAAQEIVERLNTYVATGQSIDRLARICAIDERVLHECMTGAIFHDTSPWRYEESLGRIGEYLDTLVAMDDKAAYATTPTFQRIQDLISLAHRQNIIVACPRRDESGRKWPG